MTYVSDFGTPWDLRGFCEISATWIDIDGTWFKELCCRVDRYYWHWDTFFPVQEDDLELWPVTAYEFTASN